MFFFSFLLFGLNIEIKFMYVKKMTSQKNKMWKEVFVKVIEKHPLFIFVDIW